MRSATSCFKTLLRSDLRHYWPIGFAYAAIWVIGLPVTIWNRCMGWDNKANQLKEVISATFEMQFMGVIMAAIFGVLMAMAVFSYLMTARSVGLHHALPVKRSTQFMAHFTSAMVMLLAGNVVAFVLALVVEGVMGAVGLKALLWWLLVVSLLDVIFLSLGIFCAMLTGWVLAVPVIYAGVNYVVALVELLLNSMAENFYFGYVSRDLSAFSCWMSPTIKLGEALDADRWGEAYVGKMNMESLHIVVIYAVLALVLLGISLALYRLRHSEFADDPVAFPWARPIFRCIIALVGGMSLGMGLYDLLLYDGGDSMIILLVCILAMMALCYFAAEMLIRKSFRVFRRSWKGLAVLSAVMILVCVGMKLDVFGYQTYVPEVDEVKSVTVSVSCGDYVEGVNCTDAETIAAAIAAHRAALERGMEPGGREFGVDTDQQECSVDVSYTMKNGRDVDRNYYVNTKPGSELHKAVNAVANTDTVRKYTLLGSIVLEPEKIYGGYVSFFPRVAAEDGEPMPAESGYQESLTKAQAQKLYRAILRDAELGHGERDMMDDTQRCELEMDFNAIGDREVYLDHITPDCSETIAVLLELGVTNKAENLFVIK